MLFDCHCHVKADLLYLVYAATKKGVQQFGQSISILEAAYVTLENTAATNLSGDSEDWQH